MSPINSILANKEEQPELLVPLESEAEKADEKAWSEQFTRSEDFLMQLVKEAQEERCQGKLLPLETIFED